MIFMLFILLVLLSMIGGSFWFAAAARRRDVPPSLVRVGVIDLCCGLISVGFISLHLTAVVGRAISGRGFGGAEVFAYNFRFYALVLMGVVILLLGLMCLRMAQRLTAGDLSAWTPAISASGLLLLVAGPAVPLDGFALGIAGFGGINLIALWATRRSFT